MSFDISHLSLKSCLERNPSAMTNEKCQMRNGKSNQTTPNHRAATGLRPRLDIRHFGEQPPFSAAWIVLQV